MPAYDVQLISQDLCDQAALLFETWQANCMVSSRMKHARANVSARLKLGPGETMRKYKLVPKQALHAVTAPRLQTRVLINGFMRSGTTWLQQVVRDALQAQTIFEPLSPATHEVSKIADPDAADANHHIFMPLSIDGLYAYERRALDRALKGIGNNGYAYILTPNFSDAFSTQLVVKIVRGGFILSGIAARFELPILHIRRHPASVLASFQNTDWTWSLADVLLRDVYAEDAANSPAEADLIATLHRFDTDPDSRFSALWALSERAAQATIDQGDATLVRYEDHIGNPRSIVDLLQTQGLQIHNQAPADMISPVTVSDRTDLTRQQRLSDWKQRLTAKQIDTLKGVIGELFPLALEDDWDV